MNFFQSTVYTKWAITEVGVTHRISASYYVEVLKYGFFPMLSLLLTNLNYRIDIIMLGNFGNVPIADIGIYGLAVQLAEKVGIVTDTAQEVLLSHLAKDKKLSEVARVVRSCIFVTVIIAVVFFAVGKILIPFLYGEEFSGAYHVTSLCLISPIVIIVFKMVAQYNIVSSQQKRNALMLMVGIAINIALNLLLVPALGIMGAACGTVIGNTVCAFVFLVYFSRLSGIKVKDIVFIKAEDYKELKKLVGKRKMQNENSDMK
jgi:O-antigen/teichoic acid export membrane protein